MFSVEQLIINFCSSLCLAIWIVFLLDFKWRKQVGLIIPFVWSGFYLMIRYLIESDRMFWAGLLELSTLFLAIILFVKGSPWRNYFILLTCYVVQNVLFSGYCLIDRRFADAYMMEVTGVHAISMRETLIDFFFRTGTTILIGLLFSKIFKKNYRGGDTVYKILVVAYVVVNGTSMATRLGYLNGSDEPSDFIYPVMCVATFVSILIAFVLIFNWFETFRMYREQEQLENLVLGHYQQLKKEIENPSVSRSLSGDLVLDSVMMGYAEFMQKEQIIFESMLQPWARMADYQEEILILLDYLLEIASYYSKNSEVTPFVWLSFRDVQGNLVVKLEFTKALIDRIKRKTVFSLTKEQQKINKKLEFVQNMVAMYDGIMNVSEKEQECTIQFMLLG